MKYSVIFFFLLVVFSSISMSSANAEEILILVENEVRKVYYTGENIVSVSFNHRSASVIFEAGGDARLEVKAPKVYKHFDPGLVILRNGLEVDAIRESDECFYYLTFETEKSEKIEIVFAHWPEFPEVVENCETFAVSPPKQISLGASPKEVQCQKELVLITKSSDGSPACVKPETKQKLIERGWAKPVTIENASGSKNTEKDTIAKLLAEYTIEYLPDKLVVTGGPAIRGDPRCGAAIDLNATTHWFIIDSISNPQKMTLFSENPNPCQVNTDSCFCDVQMEVAALTLDSMSYFSPEEEKKFANVLIDYLVKENINRTPKFMIGKFNINYTNPSAIGYCGELWGYNTIDFFSGAIVDDQVKNYGLESELPPICSISEDAKWWERK